MADDDVQQDPDRGLDPHDGHGHDEGRCDEALAELYTFLDGELTDEKRIVIQHHLDDCSPCLEVYDFEAELRMVIRQRCRDQVPDSLRRQVADRLAGLDPALFETGGDATL